MKSHALCAMAMAVGLAVVCDDGFSQAPQAASSSSTAARAAFDVRNFGAVGNGKVLDTSAINSAIDAAAAAGGGTVYFPAGTYSAFSIHLKSNVTIYLEQGAILLAAGPTLGGFGGGGRNRGRGTAPATTPATAASAPAVRAAPGIVPAPGRVGAIVAPEILAMAPAFDAAEPNPHESSQFGANQDFGHSHFHNSFLWGENIHDVSILGPGMIDGNGLAFNPPAAAAGVGNKALSLKLCRNVTLRDITFFRSGHFSILATGVDNFTIDNVKFDTNRDAIDAVSCKNVRISNCYVNSPVDDGICLKSDFALGEPRACENVTITNCQVSGYVMGTMLDGTYDRSNVNASPSPTGRIKFGTESNGGFKNITISNCVFDHCRGLALESVDGGIIEDVTISNITMRDINNSPIFIRLGNRHRSPLGENTPVAQIRRVNISDISASGCDPRYPVNISGIPGHMIEDLRISNVRIAYLGGGSAEWAARTVPENEIGYPEPNMFGVLNAAGFFIRHVRGLEMHHIDVTFDKPDQRPIFVMTDVVGADFQHMNLQKTTDAAYFSLDRITGFSTEQVRGVADMRREKVDKESIDK